MSRSQFLVRSNLRLPEAMDADEKARLIEAEYERARELLREGTIVGIWRVPGKLQNVAIWSAADATELDGLLRGLPLSPWLEIEVAPLATHPVSSP